MDAKDLAIPAGEPAILEVAAGLVFRGDRLLIALRRAGAHQGGLWEFPGGKRQVGETYEDCLRRELREELGIEVEVGGCWEEIIHAYADRTVRLRFFLCVWTRHEPRALGCQAVAWVGRAELSRYAFPAADQTLIKRLAEAEALWG